jgi:hypothetical protein
MRSRPLLLLTALVLAGPALAGCLGDDSGADVASSDEDPLPDEVPEVPALEREGAMDFTLSNVLPAVHLGHGLYEPTIDVSDSGVIYISAHTTGVDTTGAPAYYSNDDGATWQQLPFAKGLALPGPAQGGTPPPSDEIFIVTGDDGQAWGVDITLATFPVNGWCNDGAEHCYHNPDAYDEARAQTSRAEAATGQDESCSELNLNDRPWTAYADGKLLLVNNPGGGPVQVGSMDVPPAQYVDTWDPVQGPQWNLCAGEGGGGIPGIPDMRDDHLFAVPQMQDDQLVVVTGNAEDVSDVEQRPVFRNTHESVSAVGMGEQVVFDDEGTMFVSAMNNSDTEPGPGAGAIHLAVSHDDGESFTERTIRFDRPVSSTYLDGNEHGPGAVINWGLTNETDGVTDWYLGHLVVAEDGTPVIRNASLAVDDGPPASRHVQGAAVGPDGRAYMVMSEVTANDAVERTSHVGERPMSVVVQEEGPTLPVDVPEATPVSQP